MTISSLLSRVFFVVLFSGITLFTNTLQAQYTIHNEFGNLTECDTMTRGIYIVWWDNDWDYSEDADELLDSMLAYRNYSLNDFNMEDPPNPQDGYYYNVYLHNGNDLFPDWWANGQGTDANGYPYLTLPIGAHLDWVNVAHETFHVFQYSANSVGFGYWGDSQWYIEASANWFAAIANYGYEGAFLEAESLVRLPQVPLWLSFDNFPEDYPENWQRYVHQYGMALLLYYLTEVEEVPDDVICSGFFAETFELPQEYLYNQIGSETFRNYFINWAAHMTNHFDFLTADQIAVLENEWEDYASEEDDFEFVQIYEDEGSNGWYRPENEAVTRAWAFNTYRLNNASDANYTFRLNGDIQGSIDHLAYFQGKVVVINEATGTTFYDLDMEDAITGELSLNLYEADSEVYFIIASMPEVFENVEQTFSYEMQIEKNPINAIHSPDLAAPTIIERYNLLGQKVAEDYQGVQIILFSDGHAEKVVQF